VVNPIQLTYIPLHFQSYTIVVRVKTPRTLSSKPLTSIIGAGKLAYTHTLWIVCYENCSNAPRILKIVQLVAKAYVKLKVVASYLIINKHFRVHMDVFWHMTIYDNSRQRTDVALRKFQLMRLIQVAPEREPLVERPNENKRRYERLKIFR
jgi:hypothetical protein